MKKVLWVLAAFLLAGGLAALVAAKQNPITYEEVDASVAPIEPDPPIWLSITTGLPHRSPSFWPTRRAITSSGPPAANGTTNRTGFEGYVSCAFAANAQERRKKRMPLLTSEKV